MEFTAHGERIVVSLPEGAYLRMGRDAVELLRSLDGTRSSEEVAVAWSARLGSLKSAELLQHFTRLNLLETAAPAAGERRLTRPNPVTIQLTLYRPHRLTGALAALGVIAGHRSSRLLYALLLAGGACATATRLPDMARSLLDPSPGMWWHILLAMIAVNICHEFGHATAVAALGGHPRRMGIALLYYVCPAFFCDVSSSWRLPRGARVVVALAGVLVNAGMAALSALAAAADVAGHSEFWWRMVLANLFTVTINLIPFLRLDGYLLLLAFVDEPFVRPRAMADARSWLSHHIWRRSPQPRQFARRWSVPYGLLAIVCPALLISFMLLALAPLLFSFGWPGTVIWTLATLLALARLADGILRVARPAAPASAGRPEPTA
ncbi:hypothetical protein ABT390_37060 [Streptomyces aurantiacus]|uniref:Peptide zinc metalloprotease protein n=1 Tax=Streptomyces aurantiacus JA 4570 TaxID=1286094 RepID=S3ZP12_9ACTN|nr:hypothetical protein [Streptomyces aurantiacus]EPH45246.1 hypothetical protein STRAU_1722 [Streptomyces aurantiacus JA 4570]